MDGIKSVNFKTILLTLAILGIVAIAVFSIDIILTLFASFVITCAVVPIINKMETKMPRIWAVVLILLAMILGSFLVLIPLISICVKEALNFLNNFPNLIDDIDRLLNIQIFGKTLSSMLTLESIKEPIVQGAQSMISNSIVAGKWVVNFITTFFAIAITVFYLAYDEKRLTEKFIEFFPKRQKEKARVILANISQKVGNYIFAQGIAMVFVGLATTVGLLCLNHSHAFLLGVITCVMDIIPVLGPVIAIGLGVLTSFQSGFVYVLLVLLIYTIAQWLQNQLLRPIVFGKLLNMHPLVIIVALLLSARFLGLFGVILSPAIACVVCVLVDELYLNRINKK